MSWVRRVVTWGLALAFVHVCVVDLGKFCRAVVQGGTPEYHAELKKRKRLDKQRLRADALLAQQEASTRPKRVSKLVAKRKGAALDAAPSERVSQASAKMRKGKRRKYVSSEAMRQLNPEQ